MALHDLARMTSATTGTGTLTLGSAVSGFLTFANAGVVDAETVVYSIRDGADSEVGIGTYTASGTTLSRDTVFKSTNGGAKINCTGAEEIFITVLAEFVAPSLLNNPDIPGWYQGAAAVVSYEFDGGASPLTWSAAIDSESVNAAGYRSHLYVQDNSGSESLGTFSWSPAGAFDIACKVSMGAEVGTSASVPAVALTVGDSSMANRVLVLLAFSGAADAWQIQAYTYASSTFTQRGATIPSRNVAYLRLVRDGSNNCSFYYSGDGLTWLLIATQSFTFTAAKAGIRTAPVSLVMTVAIDWIRTTS